MSMSYIRNAYSVPAYRGAKVRFTPDSRDKPMIGRIVSAHAALLRCRFDGTKRPWNCHPTWQMEYMTPDGWWNPETRTHRAAERTAAE